MSFGGLKGNLAQSPSPAVRETKSQRNRLLQHYVLEQREGSQQPAPPSNHITFCFELKVPGVVTGAIKLAVILLVRDFFFLPVFFKLGAKMLPKILLPPSPSNNLPQLKICTEKKKTLRFEERHLLYFYSEVSFSFLF